MLPETRERPGGNPGALKTLSHQPSATATSVAPSSSDTLEAALDYLARGWSILPLRPGGKEPLNAVLPSGRWGHLAEHAAAEVDVRRWFELCPNMNLGIIAGEVSQRLALIDIDYGEKPNSNGLTMPGALRGYVESRDTPVVWTPSGGVHIYARSPGHVELDNKPKYLGGATVEFRGEAGQHAAPPSVFRGTAYRWAKPLEDTELASAEEVLTDLRALFAQLPAANNPRKKEHLSSRVVCAAKERKPASKPKAENQRAARGLERWDADRGFVQAFIDLLDIRAEPNWERGTSTTFKCVMHNESSPSARLFETENGQWAYADHHQRGGRPVYPLVDVYAYCKHKVRGGLTRNQRAAWKLRMLWEMKLLDGVYLEHPRLPDDLSRDGLQVLEGFMLLRALQWEHRPDWRGNPTSFARNFAAQWCGLPKTKRFDQARNELLAKKLLVQVGELSKMITTKKGEEKERKTKLFTLPAYADTEKEG